jgi:hypothetical protein
MNERFKELAEQAEVWNVEGDSDKCEVDLEKFAELIVRECDRYARSAWEHGDLLGRDLLIHFGVEE